MVTLLLKWWLCLTKVLFDKRDVFCILWWFGEGVWYLLSVHLFSICCLSSKSIADLYSIPRISTKISLQKYVLLVIRNSISWLFDFFPSSSMLNYGCSTKHKIIVSFPLKLGIQSSSSFSHLFPSISLKFPYHH